MNSSADKSNKSSLLIWKVHLAQMRTKALLFDIQLQRNFRIILKIIISSVSIRKNVHNFHFHENVLYLAYAYSNAAHVCDTGIVIKCHCILVR